MFLIALQLIHAQDFETNQSVIAPSSSLFSCFSTFPSRVSSFVTGTSVTRLLKIATFTSLLVGCLNAPGAMADASADLHNKTLTLLPPAPANTPVISSVASNALSVMNYVSDPMYATTSRNIETLGNLAKCMSVVTMAKKNNEPPEVEKLKWDSNPLGITLGEPVFATYRGAIVGNLMIIMGFPLIGYDAALLYSRAKGQPLMPIINKWHVPGLIALPISVLAPATIGAASTMVSHAYNTGSGMTASDMAFVALAASYAAIAPIALYSWLGRYFQGHGKLKKVELERPQSFDTMEVVKHCLSWLMEPTQRWKKSDTLERFHAIMEPVRAPFFPLIDLSNALLIATIAGSASQCTHQECCIISNGLCCAISAAYLLTHLVLQPCLAHFDKVAMPTLELLTMLVSAFSLAANISQTTDLLDNAAVMTDIAFYSTWFAISATVLSKAAPLVYSGIRHQVLGVRS